MVIGVVIVVILLIAVLSFLVVFQTKSLTIDGVTVKVIRNRFTHDMKMKVGKDNARSHYDRVVGISAKRGSVVERKGM